MKQHAPAAERNKAAIEEVLGHALHGLGTALEVASGSGEHAVHFAKAFPSLTWQPSDKDPAALASIEAWRTSENIPNLLPPLLLDAASDDWPIDEASGVVCINMVHISPWSATLGLLKGAARILGREALLYLYGPFRQRDVPTVASNNAFDASLKARNPDWGLRYVEDIAAAAKDFYLQDIVPMPANNLSLLFRR